MTIYDDIGCVYSARRRSDPRIAQAIDGALRGCRSILNVGAGAGSYEPRDVSVVAVEPSRIMISQRTVDAAPVVQACAEALPFPDGSFDAVLGILTLHHWKDQRRGLSECARVAKSKVVFLTSDFDVCVRFWLFDYFPGLLSDNGLFPGISYFEKVLGTATWAAVPVPADCQDGFLGAYWKRPHAYLDPTVRAGISTFSKIGNIDAQLMRLQNDLDSGEWEKRYPELADLRELDLGYRILTFQHR